MEPLKTWLGYPYPLGATWMGNGVNFALFSENATAVELCLFDSPDAEHETVRIPVRECTDQIWHIFLPDLQPGQPYGYRVYGPYDPANGHRFNGAKLLLDPYAKAIAGKIDWDERSLPINSAARSKTLPSPKLTAAGACPKRSSSIRHLTGAATSRRRVRWPSWPSMRCTSQGSTKLCPGRAGGTARDLRRPCQSRLASNT